MYKDDGDDDEGDEEEGEKESTRKPRTGSDKKKIYCFSQKVLAAGERVRVCVCVCILDM